jgi:hypothetical protein
MNQQKTLLYEDSWQISKLKQDVEEFQIQFKKLKEVWSMNPNIPAPSNFTELAGYSAAPEAWIRPRIAERIRKEGKTSVSNFFLSPEKLSQMTEIPDLDLIINYLPSISKYVNRWSILDFKTGEVIQEKYEQVENGHRVFTEKPETIEAYEALKRVASDLTILMKYGFFSNPRNPSFVNLFDITEQEIRANDLIWTSLQVQGKI